MKDIPITIAATFALCFVLQGQNTNRLSTEMKAAYQSVKNNILKSAEKMPDENYGFKPTQRYAASPK